MVLSPFASGLRQNPPVFIDVSSGKPHVCAEARKAFLFDFYLAVELRHEDKFIFFNELSGSSAVDMDTAAAAAAGRLGYIRRNNIPFLCHVVSFVDYDDRTSLTDH